jgi:hypothetical protein
VWLVVHMAPLLLPMQDEQVRVVGEGRLVAAGVGLQALGLNCLHCPCVLEADAGGVSMAGKGGKVWSACGTWRHDAGIRCLGSSCKAAYCLSHGLYLCCSSGFVI